MNKTIIKFRFFTINGIDQEEAWLRSMAKQGYRLTQVSFPGFYQFEVVEPQDLVYRLDYNLDGQNHRDQYTQLYQDYGWTYITTMVGYNYFVKPADQCTDHDVIFSDQSSKIDMIARLFKGRVVPYLAIIALIILFVWWSTLDGGSTIDEALVFTCVVLIMVMVVLGIYYWYYHRIKHDDHQ